MASSYFPTSIGFDPRNKADSQTKETDSNLRCLISVAIGTGLAVAGVFIVLATAQVVPPGVNVMSSWGKWGYVAAAILIGGGFITTIISLIVHFLPKPKKDASPENTIGDQEYKHFCAYRKGDDKAYAHASGASFFYYDCDEVKDYGWGCAWRCMQICASSVNLFPKFNDIYEKYRRDATSKKEWAEPGYGKQYLDDEGIPNQLILYNKESGTSKTPTEWCEKIRGFSALRDLLIAHFTRYATPVMADDVTFAMTIVGIRVTAADETILFIADPHKISREGGLYYVVLDNEGKQIATTGVDNGKNGLSTVKSAHFNKGWMLLFPQPN